MSSRSCKDMDESRGDDENVYALSYTKTVDTGRKTGVIPKD